MFRILENTYGYRFYSVLENKNPYCENVFRSASSSFLYCVNNKDFDVTYSWIFLKYLPYLLFSHLQKVYNNK